MTKLYHRDVFLPDRVKNMRKSALVVKPTKHALNEAERDKYGKVNIPFMLTFSGADIVEVEFVHGKLTKVVVRLSYDTMRDAVYALLADGTLKTCWTNLKSDGHATLNRGNYSLN